MTVYTDANSAKHATLVAATADTVTFPVDAGTVEVLNRGADFIFATTDRFLGAAGDGVPTVLGNNCAVIAPGGSLQVPTTERAPVSVRLIAATAVAYSVTVVAG